MLVLAMAVVGIATNVAASFAEELLRISAFCISPLVSGRAHDNTVSVVVGFVSLPFREYGRTPVRPDPIARGGKVVVARPETFKR